jgi:hypothetical protein
MTEVYNPATESVPLREPFLISSAHQRFNKQRDTAEESPYRADKPPVHLIQELETCIRSRRQEAADCGIAMPSLAAVRIEPGSAFSDIARYVEARDFKDAWYSDMPVEKFDEEMHEEYGPYDDYSRFILLLDSDISNADGLIGMARVVGGRTDLLKTVNDIPAVWGISPESILEDIKLCHAGECEPGVGLPETTLDHSSFVVGKKYRNTVATPIISLELYNWSKALGANTVTTVFVKDFLKLYQFRGLPFRTIAGVEPRLHMNEMSLPAVMHLPEVPYMQFSDNPRTQASYRQMALGEGLDFMAFDAI